MKRACRNRCDDLTATLAFFFVGFVAALIVSLTVTHDVSLVAASVGWAMCYYAGRRDQSKVDRRKRTGSA